ncbi:MAG: penicillin-binding protein activator [Deltaproteobacteria bacterium]|nr:penicillin-binding protein activator [Deltaproteobacteria bacterium]
MTSFLALLFLVSCVTGTTIPRNQRPTFTPENDLAQADAASASGNFLQAQRLYANYLQKNPATPKREQILAALGAAAAKNRDYTTAVSSYNELLRDFPTGTLAADVRPRLPELYLASRNYFEALNLARSYLPQAGGDERSLLQLVEGKALFGQESYAEALRVFLTVLSTGNVSSQNEARQGVIATLKYLPQTSLNNLASSSGHDFPGPEAVWFMAYQSAMGGDIPTFLAQAQYFKTYFPNHPWGAYLDTLQSNPQGLAIPGGDFDPRFVASGGANDFIGPIATLNVYQDLKIAAILPLTGENASFGQEVLAGLKLALDKMGGRIGLIELDTSGTPANAVKHVATVAEDPGVLAIVGPISSPESLAAAQTAQQLGIPLIAVSQRLGLTVGRPYVFRVFLTPKHQAEAVARYAVKERGQMALGVLYPDDAYGKAMFSYFQAEVLRLGAQVTVQESYNFQNNTWKDSVDRITGGKSVRRADTSYQAEVNFTALYLPDSAPVVSQLLPQIAYNDVTRVFYLGSPLWVTDTFARSMGKYLEDSAIPVPFSPLSRRPEVRLFIEAYRGVAQKDPILFSAYGHDAGLAVVSALASGVSTRADLARAILNLPVIHGVTGPFRFDAEGEYLLEPVLLTIQGIQFKLLKDSQEFKSF